MWIPITHESYSVVAELKSIRNANDPEQAGTISRMKGIPWNSPTTHKIKLAECFNAGILKLGILEPFETLQKSSLIGLVLFLSIAVALEEFMDSRCTSCFCISLIEYFNFRYC